MDKRVSTYRSCLLYRRYVGSLYGDLYLYCIANSIGAPMKLIDRYILRQYVATLLFALTALCVIFLVVNLLENLDDFMDRNTPATIILQYYINFFPEIIKLLTPVAMLLASLFTIGKLANNNEITAMKSGGMSIYRMMIPLVALSILVSLGQLYFNGWIVPVSNQKKAAIERQYLDRGRQISSLHNLHFRDTPTRNALLQYYDDVTKTGTRIAIEEYSSEITPRILRRIDAPVFRWDSVANRWMVYGGFVHEFQGDTIIARTIDSTAVVLQTTPKDITQLQRSTGEFTFDELREYIRLSSRGGKDVRKELVDYYGQYALPFANFIVVLFGVPFSSGKRKSGLAIEIGAAIFISFLYLAFTKIGQTVGIEAGMDPVLSAWLANGVFFIAGVINLLRIKS